MKAIKPDFIVHFNDGKDSSQYYVGGYRKGEFRGCFGNLRILLAWIGAKQLDHICLMSKSGEEESVVTVYPLSSVFRYELINK